MIHLNFVNLLQAGTIATGVLGALLLWLTKPKEFRGIALLLALIAFAACINILEESGLTRDLYLISPIFILLFGPVIYLASKLLIDKQLAKTQLWHLFPVIPLLLFTSHVQMLIGLGTVWRLGYAVLTMFMLLQFKRALDEQRSDSDDFSLTWLIWLLAITAVFNLIDLVRLNVQQTIPYELNVLGQGINNAVWLVAAMIIIIKLQAQKKIPSPIKSANQADLNSPTAQNDYRSIFAELDRLFTSNQWYLKPRLTLNDVSKSTGLQTREISRAINLVSEQSFNEYVNRYRVDAVCTTLTTNKQTSLTDIAADAGFSSKASFNKVFKQIKGVTPSEYKANIRV